MQGCSVCKNSSTIYTYTQSSKCKSYVNKLYLKRKQNPVLLSTLWLGVWTFMLGWRRGSLFHWLSRHLQTKHCVARPWEPFWRQTQSMPLSKWFLSLKSSQDHKFLEHRGLSYLLYIPLIFCSREGNGTPLQYSCLENPMDGEVW